MQLIAREPPSRRANMPIAELHAECAQRHVPLQRAEEIDAAALKVAYKDAKRKAEAHPSDTSLQAKYKEAKRRYKTASSMQAHVSPTAIVEEFMPIAELHAECAQRHVPLQRAEEIDAAALKVAYKDAKRKAEAHPSDTSLQAKYKEAKRRYKEELCFGAWHGSALFPYVRYLFLGRGGFATPVLFYE